MQLLSRTKNNLAGRVLASREGRRQREVRIPRWSEEEGRERRDRRERFDRKNGRESRMSQAGSSSDVTEENVRIREGSRGLFARPRL